MEKLDLIIKILGFLGTISAILFAVYQFNKGQKWQKAKLILNLINEFEDNEKIRIAREMLDWDTRTINLSNGEKIYFSNFKLINALRVVEWDDDQFDEEENIIRDSFDSFFDYFHKLYSFQKSSLLEFSDFNYFYYYFELLRDINNYKGDDTYKMLINNYIDSYFFVGIRHLLTQYSKNPTPLKIMSCN